MLELRLEPHFNLNSDSRMVFLSLVLGACRFTLDRRMMFGEVRGESCADTVEFVYIHRAGIIPSDR